MRADEKWCDIKGNKIILRRNQTLAMRFFSHSKDGEWEEPHHVLGTRRDYSYIENRFAKELREQTGVNYSPLCSWAIDVDGDDDLYMVVVKIKPGTRLTQFYLDNGFIPVTPEQLS